MKLRHRNRAGNLNRDGCGERVFHGGFGFKVFDKSRKRPGRWRRIAERNAPILGGAR